MDTRDHILTIAFKLFFKKGFKEVTMSELVKASGLSKGAFYHYFSSKEALYKEAFEKYLISYFENFKLDYDAGISLRDNLKKIAHNYSQLTEEFSQEIDNKNPRLNVYLLYIQTALNSPEFKDKLQEYYLFFHQEFDNWFQKAQMEGEIKPEPDPHFLAKQMIATMEGLFILDAFSVSHEPLEKNFIKIIDQFFDQIEITKQNDTTINTSNQ